MRRAPDATRNVLIEGTRNILIEKRRKRQYNSGGWGQRDVATHQGMWAAVRSSERPRPDHTLELLEGARFC